MNIIGREREIRLLENVWSSKEAEFLALYGRRRIGKTYLIREFFSKKGLYFELTGLRKGSNLKQLENFSEKLSATFYQGTQIKTPVTWHDALNLLTKEIQKIGSKRRIIIFFDELPWLAKKRAGLIEEIDYFWNTEWSRIKNLIFIVCGSAASWMLDKVINEKGGLHNRFTKVMLLEPFNLSVTKQYLASRGIKLTNKQLLDIYMVMGGVAHYLKHIEKGKSSAQVINDLCFQQGNLLYEELPKLFNALFDTAEINKRIVKEIAKHRYGISREVLLTRLKIKSGGTFNQRIKELEASGFIQSFVPYGRKKKEHYFRIIDEYTMFYLKWIEPIAETKKLIRNHSYWQKKSNTPEWLSWAGYAFEDICYKHTFEIQQALELHNTACEIGSWRYAAASGSKENGAQIDLLYDRDDGAITLCEIKYSDNDFVIDKKYAKELLNKIDIFEKLTQTKKQIFLALITVSGMKKNMYSEEIVHQSISLNDLILQPQKK